MLHQSNLYEIFFEKLILRNKKKHSIPKFLSHFGVRSKLKFYLLKWQWLLTPQPTFFFLLKKLRAVAYKNVKFYQILHSKNLWCKFIPQVIV